MAVSQSQPTQTRPSFYGTIRLARLVLDFKQRLKSKVKIRHASSGGIGSEIRNFKARAYEDLNQAFRSHSDSCKIAVHGRASATPTGSNLGVSSLLTDLDSHAGQPGRLPLSAIAAEDQLFLKHDIHHLTTFKSTEIQHILDITTLLLERLRQLQGSHVDDRDDDLNIAKYNANLEHLLRCLQQAALEALIHLSLKFIQAEALRWNNWLRRLAQIVDGWFAEWPNGRHPLSTTWPWNIKPSLVILWGVCWMFYAGDDAHMGEPKHVFQPRQFSENVRPRQAPLLITSQPNAGTWALAGIHSPPAPSQWLQPPAENDTRLVGRANNRNSDYQSTLPDNYAASSLPFSYIFSPTASSDRFSGPLNSQPDTQGSNTSFPTSSEYTFGPDWPSLSQSQLFTPSIGATGPGGQIGYIGFNVPSNQQATPILQSASDVSHQSGLQLPMGEMQNYPSPGSDYSGQTRPSYPPVSPIVDRSPDMPSADSLSTEPSPQTRSGEIQKSLEPTKNAEGKIYCAHPECVEQPPIFGRKCEWTKHMDKHNRPYVCEEPGCEKIQGFTYSGGLLRHQREVHRQHGGPKASCMCPFRDCKRSTGVGFSRKENLSEHLRRVHRGVGEQEKVSITDTQYLNADQGAAIPTTMGSKKRKQRPDHPEDERRILEEPRKRRIVQDNDPQSQRDAVTQPQTLQQQVDSMARELHLCQDRIKKLEQAVEQMNRTRHVHL